MKSAVPPGEFPKFVGARERRLVSAAISWAVDVFEASTIQKAVNPTGLVDPGYYGRLPARDIPS
jgi:hypothetical protein